MKIKKLLATTAAAFIVAGLVVWGLNRVRPHAPPPPPDDLPQALVVFCFHGNDQVRKAGKMQRWTKELLDKSFSEELKTGRLQWRIVNYEEPNNAHYVKKYHLANATIVVDDGRPGNPGVATNYEPKAWSLIDNKAAFLDYFREEIAKSLKKK